MLFKSLLDKLWQVSATKGAYKVLAFVAFTESIFFPIPPDLFLIPMALSQRQKAFRLAAHCLVFSVVGGVIGYGVGYFFMDAVGMPIVEFYGLMDKYVLVQEWYEKYNAWAVAAAGLTPIPYKLCTLTAGAFHINFFVFLVASIISRGVRFFIVVGLIYLFGEKVRFFLEKRFGLVMLLTLVGVVAGFLVIKYLL
jgi:membrane protein YqaA with SNARE-associated domain